MTVYVLIVLDFGDQGVGFLGVYKTYVLAQTEVARRVAIGDGYTFSDFAIWEQEVIE